jgi:membrane-associated phospholipid phosphatase
MKSVFALCLLSCAVLTSPAYAASDDTCGGALQGCQTATSGPFKTLFAGGRIGAEANPLPEPTSFRAVVSNLTKDRDAIQQPTAPTAPKPEHTGIAALVYTTGADFKAFPRRASTWVILGIGAGAAGLTHPFDDNIQKHYADSDGAGWLKPGKYIGSFYVQLGTATGLYLIGRYAIPPKQEGDRTNRISHLGFDLVRALVVSQALTQGIKYASQRDRPTGECCAFPSGHASAAFATASVLERHLGYRGAWPTFVIASYVAASRLSDNRHFLSDVMFGSALGIASGWTVVGRHGRSEYAMVPVPTKGGVMLALQSRPRTDSRRRATQ